MTIGIAAIVFCGSLAARRISPKQSDSANTPIPTVLESDEGEKREFRARPGVTFTLKIGPKNSGSQTMAVVTEDMAPGDKIPTHRHPHADELILIQSGTGKVMLGDKVQVAHAGAIVFIPKDTWISMENIGADHRSKRRPLARTISVLFAIHPQQAKHLRERDSPIREAQLS